MLNPNEKQVEHMAARVRCRECRSHFHARLQRIVHGDTIDCPICDNDMEFHGLRHIRENETIADYIRYIEEHTLHLHFMASD
jgi:hydrogenase maturation factor HypF (carbamoyltransferase family)